MNHLSHDYQLPDDSFLYNLDVNDWSMLAHPEETDQPDGDRTGDDRADKADDSSDGNLGDGHSYSLEIAALDSELEQMMLAVEYGRQKLEELERMLPETRWLLQELEEQTSYQTFQLDPELGRVTLEAEQVRQKLDDLEWMIQEARQLAQDEGQSSRQMLQFDPKLEQIILEVEHGWRRLEELELMLQEARRLVQDEEQTSYQTFQLDSEFEQVMLRVEYGRQKLEELEQILQEARRLAQELEESEEQGPRQTLQPDTKRESPKRTTSLTLDDPEELRNRPYHSQFKEMNQGIDRGYGMGRR